MSDPKLRRKLKGRFAEKEDKPKYMPGLLGNGQGVVNTGTDGIVYVRVNEMATTAVCTSLPPVNDLPVWVYKPAFDKARLHVHSQRFYGGEDEQIISGTSQHAETHRYFGSGAKGGTDVLHVDPRQILGLRIYPIENTMTCAVFPWVVLIDGVPKLIGTLEEDGTYTAEVLDFAPYLITTEDKSKIMLVTLDNTGALVITEGAEVDTDAIDIETDTPAVPASTKVVIGAVRLYYGQYAIQEGRENTDLMDWRWLYYHVHDGGSGELDIGIDGLNDVTISTIGDLNVLQYDSAGGAWVNKTLVEAGINPMTTAGDIIYGGVDGAATRLAIGAVTQVLTVSAGGTTPEWATAAEGFVNPMTTIGDFIYGGTDGEATRLAIGGALEVLRINAAGTGPEWYLSTSFENPMTTIGDIVYGTTDGAVTRLAIGTEAQILAIIGGIPGWTNAGTDIGFSNPMTTIGDIIYATTDGEAARLAIGSTGQFLKVVDNKPSWGAVTALENPMTTHGDIIYGTTDGTPTRLAAGTAGYYLKQGAVYPEWAAAPAGFSTGDINQVELHTETLTTLGRFDVSSISQDYDHLLIYSSLKSSETGASNGNDLLNLWLNNDTTASNYHCLGDYRSSGGTGELEAASSQMYIHNSYEADYWTEIELLILNYAGAKSKDVIYRTFYRTAAANIVVSMGFISWESTAAINQITAQPDGYATEKLIAGSYLQIIGIKTTA